MAKLLHIETSTKVCSVALSNNGNLVDLEEENSDGYIHGEKLTIFIDNITKRNNWELKEIDAIVVTSGPGSYTGLRIGVSTAKGLCYALKKPLISVDAVESIARIASETHKDINICAMIDARRMEVFATIYNAKMEVIKPLSADILTEESYLEYIPFVVCGDGAEKVQSLWNNPEIIVDATILSSAKGQVEVAFRKFENKEFEDVAYFEPKYLKDFVTTTPKNKTGF
ncbi:MAG TPA: tRNA (adenosine(37)-N6)-threonylcarbamoyltransferase complex dimerization subunit type 1 TsaB [Brumimicrobium sp.]|nr:tRNA (adenosine(37)-N6)-threonylcarbamoyltransferase complex dimerization subunit type 1 TsaB [Brumimicrobium sp.]